MSRPRDPRATASRRAQRSLAPSGKGRGAVVGTLVGASLGVAFGLATGEGCGSSEWLCFDHGTMALVGVMLFAPAGAIIGAIAAPGERWVTVDQRRRVGVTIAPTRRGAQLALALRF